MNSCPPRPLNIRPCPPRSKGEKSFVVHQQTGLFQYDGDDKKSAYTSKIKAPIYEPSGKKPDIFSLVDKSKFHKLCKEILESRISDDEKEFLVKAAGRHNVFNYRLIADYYAHSSREMQELMEKSALVIIDFDDALKYGYVKYSEEIAKIYVDEHGKS